MSTYPYPFRDGLEQTMILNTMKLWTLTMR